MTPWFECLLIEAECCARRAQGDQKIIARARDRPSIHPLETSQNSAELACQNRHCHVFSPRNEPELISMGLPDTFFLQIAEHCVNDPSIGRRIEDDRNCEFFWGEARSLRFQFLQMCLRDRWVRCREIWTLLSEFERRDFMDVAKYGPPSDDFFLNMMVNDELLLKEGSDAGSTESGINTSPGSSNKSVSGHQ